MGHRHNQREYLDLWSEGERNQRMRGRSESEQQHYNKIMGEGHMKSLLTVACCGESEEDENRKSPKWLSRENFLYMVRR